MATFTPAAALAVVAAAVSVGGAGAQFPWSITPPPAFPISHDCSATNTGHLLSASDVAFDWDANCFMNATDFTWRSKVGGLVADWRNITAASRTQDLNRGVWRAVLSSSRKIVLPFNMGPTAEPTFSLEILASIGSVVTSTPFRAVFTTEAPGTVTPTSRGRGGLVYDAAGSGAMFSPWCATSPTSNTLAIGSGL
jgi:hypothetical protein